MTELGPSFLSLWYNEDEARFPCVWWGINESMVWHHMGNDYFIHLKMGNPKIRSGNNSFTTVFVCLFIIVRLKKPCFHFWEEIRIMFRERLGFFGCPLSFVPYPVVEYPASAYDGDGVRHPTIRPLFVLKAQKWDYILHARLPQETFCRPLGRLCLRTLPISLFFWIRHCGRYSITVVSTMSTAHWYRSFV